MFSVTHDILKKAMNRHYEEIHKALVEAQKQRRGRNGFVSMGTPWGTVEGFIEWNVYEMQTVLDSVNFRRLGSALPALTIQDIMKIEHEACGHSDYTHKFALYAAELCDKK
jgi:hypothetical protein